MLRRLALVLVCSAGCAHGELVAPSGQHRLIVQDAATGVTIVLTTSVWTGEPADLDEQVTVIHALFANSGDRPLLLAPGDLELRDARGFRYELLDTGASFMRVDGPDAAQGYDRELERSYDPGRSLEFEPFLVTGDAAPLAFPWGVLEPGTQMRGFLYFEPVARTADEAKLVWHVSTADHQSVLDAAFVFFVAREPKAPTKSGDP